MRPGIGISLGTQLGGIERTLDEAHAGGVTIPPEVIRGVAALRAFAVSLGLPPTLWPEQALSLLRGTGQDAPRP